MGRPFISTPKGWLFYCFAVSASIFSLLAVADLTPPFFVSDQRTVQNMSVGIHIGSPDNFVPEPGMWPAIIVIIFLVTFATWRLNHLARWYQKQEIGWYIRILQYRFEINWPKLLIITTILSGLLYGIFITYLGVIPGISPGEERGVWVVAGVKWAWLAQSLLFGLLSATYAEQLVPDSLPDGYDDPVHAYIANQWRLGQILLSFTVATVVGLVFPFTESFTGHYGLRGLVFLLGIFLFPLGAMVIFIALRLHQIEKSRRNRDD